MVHSLQSTKPALALTVILEAIGTCKGTLNFSDTSLSFSTQDSIFALFAVAVFCAILQAFPCMFCIATAPDIAAAFANA